MTWETFDPSNEPSCHDGEHHIKYPKAIKLMSRKLSWPDNLNPMEELPKRRGSVSSFEGVALDESGRCRAIVDGKFVPCPEELKEQAVMNRQLMEAIEEPMVYGDGKVRNRAGQFRATNKSSQSPPRRKRDSFPRDEFGRFIGKIGIKGSARQRDANGRFLPSNKSLQ